MGMRGSLRAAEASPVQGGPFLLGILESLHNHIYANEGLGKEAAFREALKLVVCKIVDERFNKERPLFRISPEERRRLEYGEPAPSFAERWSRLIRQAQSLLPGICQGGPGLSPHSLAYAVALLQDIPLDRLDTDVKGEVFQSAFQKYHRGGRGEFFTPKPVADLAVALLRPEPGERIIDPACGSGGFLLAAWQKVREGSAGAGDPPIWGLEINPEAAMAAQVRFLLEGLPPGRIVVGNALQLGLAWEGGFDVVVANPPFGTKGKVADKKLLALYDLGYRWVDQGRGWSKTPALREGQTPELLFLELIVRLLRPGGRAAVVIPDGILLNKSYGYVRWWLLERTALEAVVSLPQVTFAPFGTGIKTSLVVLSKKDSAPSNAVREGRVFFALVRHVGYNARGRPDRSDLPQVEWAYREWKEAGRTPSSPLAKAVSPPTPLSRLDAEFHVLDGPPLAPFPTRKLAEIADIVREKWRGVSFQGEVSYVEISDVHPSFPLIVSWKRFASAEDLPSRAAYRLKAGDIITAVAGASTGTERHATALVTQEEEGFICTNGFAVLRNVRGVDPYYLLAFLRSPLFLGQVRRKVRGQAIPVLDLDDLAEVEVLLPPRKIQEEIGRKVFQALRLMREALSLAQEAAEQASALHPKTR